MSAVVERLLGRRASTEEAETHIRAAVGKIGMAAMQAFMQAEADRADAQRITPRGTVRHGRRPIWVRSLWGDFQIYRAYYTGKDRDGASPADRLLGLWSSYTPAMARILTKLAAQVPFDAAAELLHDTTHATVNGRQFHRLTAETANAARAWTAGLSPERDVHDTLYVSFDGAAVPMRKECLVGRKGRDPHGQAKTREIRLGCVFTQTATDDDGNPVRDPNSTSYMAGMFSSKRFGRAVKAEAIRRGMTTARRVAVITDGANWCEKAAAMNFPGRLHILDFYHAAEHVRTLAALLLGEGNDAAVHFRIWRRALLRGKAAAVIEKARSLLGKAKTRNRRHARREIAYLAHNLHRMQYAQYREQGLFIGSGVIEAGCKTVVAQRAKLSGMFWGVQGVQNVLAIRCLLLGKRLNRFWNDTLAQRRAA
jgi:hypothetical protein